MSADAVMFPLAPTFAVATAKAPVPFVPGIFAMPSLVDVAANATMSGTGVAEAERSTVLSPVLIGAGKVLAQSKLICASVGAKVWVGVKDNKKLWGAPAGILTGVLGVLVS